MNTDIQSTMTSILKASKISLQDVHLLYLMAHGFTTMQIAALMHISENTVKTHRKRLMKHFQAHNACHLIYSSRVIIQSYEIYQKIKPI